MNKFSRKSFGLADDPCWFVIGGQDLIFPQKKRLETGRRFPVNFNFDGIAYFENVRGKSLDFAIDAA